MSWYNDEQENNFIDATQEFTGGGVSTTISEVQNTEDLVITENTPDTEETTTIGNVLLPAVFNDENGSYDLYIRNVNDGGRIFFTTRNDGEKIKVEDGKLKLYYDYDFLNAPLIPGGWTDILNYSVATRQLIIGLTANIATIDATLYTPITGIAISYPAVASATAANTAQGIDHEARIVVLELGEIGEQSQEEFQNSLDSGLQQLRNEWGSAGEDFINMVSTAAYQGGNATNILRALSRTRTNLGIGLFNAVIGISGGLSIVVGIAFGIYDRLQNTRLDETEIKLLNTFEKIKDEPNAAIANLLYKDGLAMQSATNGGFTTQGIYEVDIANGNRLEIEIDSNNIASIKSVILTAPGFSVGDTISIPKSDLGGGTGNLVIDVNTLYSEKVLIVKMIEDISIERDGILGRNRRRQFIPDKNSFNDGINVVETSITEPSGEITKELEINLKIDPSQFQYDISGNLQIRSSILTPATDPLQFTTDALTGNLQIINYDKIAEIGDDTDGAETGLYQYVLDKIAETLGDQETYDSDGNVVVPATNIYQNINNIYELVMVGDQTFQNNNDYKLNLGYKSIWTGYAYDLITIALKATRAGIFDSSFYNNDWLGYFPSLTRISDDTYMNVVKDVNVEILTNLTFKKGLVYFEQNDPVVDYDLNRKFEFVCFIRPIDTDNAGVEYTLLQSGAEIAPGQYDLDDYKLKLGFRDNKFEITHSVKKEVDYYPSLTYKNYENTNPASLYPTTVVEDNATGETSRERQHFQQTRKYSALDQQSYKNVIFSTDWDYMILRNIFSISYVLNFGNQYLDINFNTLKSMSSPATTTWASPKIVYSEPTPILQPRNGVAKIIIAYEYFVAPSQGNTLQLKTFTSLADIDQNLEFKWRINLRKVGDPAIYGSKIYDFNQFQFHPNYNPTNANHLGFYIQELWMPTQTYPFLATDRYNYIELELVHRGGSFTPLPTGSQSYNFYAGQHSIRIHCVNWYDYDTSTTTFIDYSPETFQDLSNFFPTPIDTNHWYKFVAELDLTNKVVQYWVDGVSHYFSFDTINNIPHSSLQLPNSDPDVPYFYSADFIFVNNGFSGLVRDNDIIVIGNEPSLGELNFTHFAWKHYQDPAENYMTQEERDKLDFLINYNYYYETVKIDRYLKVKEFYADVLDARKILINGGFAYGELSPGDQITLLRSEDQSSDNVAITNAFVNIDKLFVSDPATAGNGFLSFDATTKVFSIGASTISSADVEDAVGNLIQTSPSTYGLVFDTADPNDKYLKIDDVYVNNLVNLVIQNEIILSVGFIDAVYNDVLIQVKDASSYSPYNLRELENTDVKYNYVINGNHQYLYRELNQVIQYDPLLGEAFGDLYPVVMYHFQGELINNAPDYQSLTASDYDFEKTNTLGQVVYGSAPTNMKYFNGVLGGSTAIRTINSFDISSANRGCISFFHKPFGGNVDGTDDHRILEIQNAYGNDLLYFTIEYVSNFAVYKLHFVDQTNPANVISYTFNNTENEIYFGNHNSILLWYNQPNWYWYINGKYHWTTINNGLNQPITNCKLYLDLPLFNNRSLIYELKIYPKLLFKITAGENVFNTKRVAEITEMIRIITFNTGGFILKELSGVQETKSRSIETKVRSLDTSRRVGIIESKVSLPTGGTGTAGYVYNDGISSQYDLKDAIDYTGVGTKTFDIVNREIITFNHISTGIGTFTINLKGRSKTSINEDYKYEIDYSDPTQGVLGVLDEPFPSFVYTFLSSDITANGVMQDQTFNKGQPQNGYGFSINFLWFVLSGDIFKYTGISNLWGIYYVDFLAVNPAGATSNKTITLADMTLLHMFNDGDELVLDGYKYHAPYYDTYLMYDNDFDKKIQIYIERPEIFIDKLRTGSELSLKGAVYYASAVEPIVSKLFVSQASKQTYNQYLIDDRPLFLPAGQTNISIIEGGRPAQPNDYYKWSWYINYTPIANLWESGDLNLNGNLYVKAPVGQSYLDQGILVNSVGNIKNNDNSDILGLPAKVDQVFNFVVDSISISNNQVLWSGSDRVNTYASQTITQFEFYYYDTIRITFSQQVHNEYISSGNTLLFRFLASSLVSPTNSGGIISYQGIYNASGLPVVMYVNLDKTLTSSYSIEWISFSNPVITFNFQNIKDYTNEAFLSTDEYILKYKPHSDTFIWEENIGMALDTGVLETAIPVGSFKAKSSTTQISSRRTLASSVPIEKVSQKTKYQVFNTEVEVNGNLLLESINEDIGSLFTIYTNEEKTIGGVPSFKDKANITLLDGTKEWVFKREPESEDILTATTKFIHNTTELLILKHNEVEVGVDLKVGTINFADNTSLSSATISYNDLSNQPTLFDGDYNSLTNQPTLFDGQYSSLTGAPTLALVATSGSYNDLTNTPTIPSAYTDADARSACFPLTQANTGLGVGTSGMDIFENSKWFNSLDAKNRFYFSNNSATFIRAPNTTYSGVYMQIGTGTRLYVHNTYVKTYVPFIFSDGTQMNTAPTMQNLLTANNDVITDVDTISFTDTLAFIKGDKLTLKGIATPAGTGAVSESEDFTNASGRTNTTMSGFNSNLFTNGGLGTDNVIPSSSPAFGQINGLNGGYTSGINTSGTGTGSSGSFNSLTSTGKNKYFIFNGGINRLLRTKEISSILSTCSTITFKYIVGTQSNGGNFPENNESLYLEFLSQFGGALSSILIHAGGTQYANGSNFTSYTHTLTSAQQASYYVRWMQYSTNYGNYDHYGITDITFNYIGQLPATISEIDVRLENLPTTAPTESNRMWKDANGYLRIT